MDKFTPSVSVIVPIYKVEEYIEKCARSLFEQSLIKLEIIFVDDCSPDNSVALIKKILEDYPLRKNQTKIISMTTNSGQAVVRSHGILQCNGEYVIHCDGDDWVDRDLYEKMYQKAVETSADIVVADEIREYGNRSETMIISDLPSSGKEIMRNWYKNIIGLFCHNKLVKRDLYINNNVLPWEGLNMWEDNGLFARLFYHAEKVSQIHGPMYHYNRANVNATTSGYGIQQVEQMIGIAQNLSDFFMSKPDAEEFENTANAFKYLARLNLVTDSWKNYKRFLKTFPESKYIAKNLDTNAFSRKGKFRFLMVNNGLTLLFVLMFKIKTLF